MAGEVEKSSDLGTDQAALVTRWLREIELSGNHEKRWRERAAKIVKRFRDDDRKEDTDTQTRFNILYANVEVLKGVMYQRTPVPDVRRRFLDRDPVARQAAQVLQRALAYAVDAYDFDGLMGSVVEDVLLPGRGTACVKYLPTMGTVQVTQPDGSTTQEERVVYEEVRCDYVEWEMYRQSPAKRWEKVRWVALGELMTREDLTKFGDAGKRCALDWAPKDKENEADEFFRRALVWAIWDKATKKVLFISRGLPERPLAVLDDPLNLEGFFPTPKPVYSITTTNSLTPVPEYIQYQDQAMELDAVTERIDKIVGALKRRGVYDATYRELEKLASAGDNEFIPVENYASLMEKGGLDKAIWTEPIEVLANVLTGLYQQRDQVKQTIYEITGIADIVRGATKATETLGAQELKARYANVRVAPRQKAIANFARDLLRLKAEIIAEKFSPETLKLMTGPEVWMVEQQVSDANGQPVRQKVDATGQIMQLLRDERLRGFRVDVETDSTIQPNADEEQKNRIDFLGAVTQFVTGMAPAVQSGVVPMEVAREFLSFGARAFKVSPQLEDAMDKLGGDAPQQNPDVARLTAENQQLRVAADANNVKREELSVKREEIAARQLEVRTKSEEVQMSREAEMSKVLDMIKGQIAPSDEAMKTLAAAIVQSAQAQTQMMQQLMQVLLSGMHADKELYIDPLSGRKRVRVVK